MSDKSGFGVFVEKISFLDKLSLLSKAISDNEEPTPGYMYGEISKISYESGSHCHDLLVFLVEQLTSQSCHVRLKVLKILHYVTKNGHQDFKQGLRKRSHGITESIQFSGPPDPLHEMANYLKVRAEAVALSEVLFNVRDIDEEAEQGKQLPVKPVMAGMGSAGGNKMQGFGNMPIQPKSLGESLVKSVKGFAEKVISPPHSVPYTDSTHDKRFGNYQPVTMSVNLVGGLQPTSGGNPLSQHTHNVQSISRKPQRSTVRKKGVPGGGWADPDEGSEDGSNSTHSSTTPEGRVQEDASVNSLVERIQDVKTEDWTTEENLVNDLVTDTETFYISHAELKQFTTQCSVVNCEQVLKCVNTKLQSMEEYTQLRCMLVLEALLRTDVVSADQVLNIFKKSLLNIYTVSSGKKKAKSRKILRILEKISSSGKLISADNITEGSDPGTSVPNE